MKLSVIIPVHNEEVCIKRVCLELLDLLVQKNIPHELLLINDNSTDESSAILSEIGKQYGAVRVIDSPQPKGFGRAIRTGLENFSGDAVVICMGDGSDSPQDVVAYYEKLSLGYDCVFGSRFVKGSRVIGYPFIKLFLNRAGNAFIQILFLIKYNDVSNAFKGYRKEVIAACKPFVSQYFNITVEIPLKAIVRGFRYAVVPISWYGRDSGVSKYRIKELSRKYFFSILFVWLEKFLLKEEIRK
ncbi:MAG: glycosyltransferase family 2 protein [Candidatus Omnitrophota bacterium]|nr:MAG: glycosyltransferase family 2 protein [Candidatus Omnitrophota bacterium]